MMNELPVPEYIEQRLRNLRAERLRLDGRIFELESLAQSLTIVPPAVEEDEKPKRVRRGQGV